MTLLPPAAGAAQKHHRGRIGWIAAGYAAVAAAWFCFSDQLIDWSRPRNHAPESWRLYGGLIFVLVTALLLLILMRWAFRAIEESYAALARQETEIARLQRLYAALSQINHAIVWTESRDELLEKICRVLVEQGGFGMVWAGWEQPETHWLEPVAAAGDTRGKLAGIRVYTDDRPEGRGPAGTAFRAGRTLVCNDLLHDPMTQPWREEFRQRGFGAAAYLPIREAGQTRGVLCVYAMTAHYFQDRETALLEEAAADISFALDNLVRERERVAAEAAVREEKLFSDTMIDSMPGVLYFYDMEGRFLRWNRNFETVSGCSAEEIGRMHPLDFFPPAERALVQARIGAVFEQGEASVEAPFLAKSGATTPYFFTGRRVQFGPRTCLIGVGIDITDRKRAEAALRETEHRLAVVVENLREGLVIAGPDDRHLHWNPAALRQLGFDAIEEGRRLQPEFGRLFELSTLAGEPLPPTDWPLARVRRGEQFVDLELRVRRRDTEWERIFTYSGIQASDAGRATLAFLTLADITARKQAEWVLRDAKGTLEREVAQRTAELRTALVRAEAADGMKSAFLATMSHELRTPLNSIIGFTGIVLQGLAGPINSEQGKQLGMVRGSAQHLLELINDVLDISKIEAGQLEVAAAPFDLRASIDRAVASVRPLAAKKNLALTVNLDPALGAMTGDRRRMEQVLLNLLNNAIKFTEHGGVTLEAALTTGARPAVRLRVTDTGIGIKPDDLATLFQPFRQIDTGLNRRHEGTGLGLAICRRLAVLMHGEITAASEWGRGSVFTVEVPLHPPASLS